MPIFPNLPEEEELHDIVEHLDDLLHEHKEMGAHNLAGVLLSRVVLLTEHDPSLGKDLVRYVWERLDAIEQDGAGGDIDF